MTVVLSTAALALAAIPSAAAADQIDDFQGGWIDRALRDQYRLGNELGMRNAPWVGTHNSFNSTAEMGPTLSAQDSNQRLAIEDLLRIDVRSLELDVHRFPAAPGGTPKVCHAFDMAIGCTIEKDLGPVLAEIAAWLARPENAEQVLLLYLEDHLETEEVYDEAAAIVEAELGRWLYRPAGPGCTELPLGLSRDDILAAGANAIIVSDCGVGSGWPSVVHSWDSHVEDRPFSFQGYPACRPAEPTTRDVYPRDVYRRTLVRYYEDSTQLTATAGDPDDGITPRTAAAMAGCGVDLIGLDQLTPFDGRLARLVWSWAPGQPNRGRCALIRVGTRNPAGRWISRGCRSVRRHSACRRGGQWVLSDRKLTGGAAARRGCRGRLVFAVPRTGFGNQRLRVAMRRAGVRSAWLGYRRSGGAWRPMNRWGDRG